MIDVYIYYACSKRFNCFQLSRPIVDNKSVLRFNAAAMPDKRVERLSEERELSNAELAQGADRLITDFKDVLERSLEYTDALAKSDSAVISYGGGELRIYPIKFCRQNFSYGVTYEIYSHRRYLQVLKSPITEYGPAEWVEQVVLEAGDGNRDEPLSWGKIRYSKEWIEGEERRTHINTITAVGKAEEFLKEF